MKASATTRPLGLPAASLLLAVLAGAAASGGSAPDKIYQKSGGPPIEVRITDENIDGIKAGAASFNPIGIDRIEYADTPQAYREGEAMRQQARYDDAVKLFEAALRLDERMVRHFWLDPACGYQIAMCHLEEGVDMAKAEAAFKDLLAKHPNCRWLADARLGLGRVLYTAKNYSGALAEFERLAKDAAAKNWGEEWLFQSILWRARTLLDSGKLDEALREAKKIIDSAGERYGDLVTQARTIEAMVYVRKSQYTEAARLLRELIKAIGPAVAREIEKSAGTRMQLTEAQCYNALGQCLLKQATTSKKEDDYREALLAFLWTVVLHQRLTAEHAEALFHAAICFENLKDRTRATELRNELIGRYPDNQYARQLEGSKPSEPKAEPKAESKAGPKKENAK